jgi:uncharacterized protein YegL
LRREAIMKKLLTNMAVHAVLLAMSCAWAQDVYTDNIVIVLDASGSMDSPMRGLRVTRMQAAKEALLTALRQIPDTTHIGLLVFSGQGGAQQWIYPLGRRDDQKLVRAINLPMPGGDTPLGRYIKIGADRLLEERKKQHGYGTYRLLIVTDGEAQDRALVNKYVPEVIARGITTDVIGVDMQRNHTLATKVHSYRRADDPESLEKAVAEILAEVSSSGDASAAGEEAFEIIRPIPDALAASMLESLARSGNQPIGVKPKHSAPPADASSAKLHSTPPGQKTTDDGSGSTWVIIVCVLFGLFMLRLLFRRPARSRRE